MPAKSKSKSRKKSKSSSAGKKTTKQYKLRSTRYGRQVLKASGRQTGTSNKARDRKRKAMAPGKRRSASGRVYNENRKNRSDKKGSRI